MPWRARGVRPPLLRQRAGRPQLKRDPLGGAPRTVRTLSTSLSILAASLLACHDDPFGLLFNACADQMATARTTYGVPTGEHRVTMADGRRGIIWDVPGTPGGGFQPSQIAFTWDPATPGSCTFCLPGFPCWPSS